MGGGDGQKSMMARQKNTEKMKATSKGIHLESSKKSTTIQGACITKEMKYLKTTKESVATLVAVSSGKVTVKTAVKSSREEVVKKETTGYRPNNTIGRREVLVKHESKLEKVKLQQSTTLVQKGGASQFESRRNTRVGTNGGVGRTELGKLREASSVKAREREGCMEKSRARGKKASEKGVTVVNVLVLNA